MVRSEDLGAAAVVAAEVRRRLAGAPGPTLGENTARSVLEPLSFPFSAQRVVASAAEAVAAAEAFGVPVALKGVSDVVVHKTDMGLVSLGLDGAAEVHAGYGLLTRRALDAGLGAIPVAVQPMAPAGVDLLVGVHRDLVFGPVVLVGFGGTGVELHRDVARRLPHVTAEDAIAMVRSLRSFPLLDGYRGGPVYDLTRLGDLVRRVAALAETLGELHELDLNPVRIFPDGSILVLDARIGVGPGAEGGAQADGGPAVNRPTAVSDGFFRPSSVAVLGASRDPSRPGGRVVRYLAGHGFTGRIYPINPAASEVAGVRAYPSVAELPEIPDLACLALPAEATIDAARECAARGVPALIALASGFNENGAEGADRERRLREAVAGTDTQLCGPNTIGIVCPPHSLAASFSQALEVPRLVSGPVALIAQSGAVAGSLVSREFARGYGLASWVTVGNEAQLTAADYLDYVLDLGETKAVAIFLEGVRDGDRFRHSLRRAEAANIPVVVFKTGATSAGRRAVSSHSGMLAGSAEVYAAVLRQHGAVQVDEMTALLEVASFLAESPRPSGDRVALLSTSGGAASAAADAVVDAGLRIADLSVRTVERLQAVLPSFADIANPLDITAEGAFKPGAVEATVQAIAADEGVDVLGVVLTSLAGADGVRVAAEVARAARTAPVAIAVSWLIDSSLATEGQGILAAAGVRVFDEPVRMVKAMRHLVDHATRR